MPIVTARSVAEASGLLADAPSPVVVIAVHNSHDDAVRCLDAVATHTAATVHVLLVDDAGVDRRVFDLLESVAAQIPQPVVVLEHTENQGLVRSANDALAATPGRDVVFLNSDVVVGAEWLDRLTAAALSGDTVATATTLTNHGTIVSVPHRNRPVPTLPEHMTPAEAARRVAAGSQQLRPSIPTAVGHCFYLRRPVVDLIGGFDECFEFGYGEEVDLSQRAVAHGFRHVVADDVFTFHRGSGSFGTSHAVVERRDRHEEMVRQRYPWYWPWVEQVETDPSSALAGALAAARRSLLGLTVGVDGLCLGQHLMGTQQNVVQTIRALARRPEIDTLVAYVPTHLPRYVDELRRELRAVEFVRVNLADGIPERAVDLVYRPYQVSEAPQLEFLHRVADRFVVNQLDTIAFENPAYFASHDDWVSYRNLTRLTLRLAHGVAFLSDAGHRAALDAGVLDPATPAAVVSCGTDDADGADRAPAADQAEPGAGEAPLALQPVADNGFLVCVGASYLHKNRRFALEVWVELRRRGWPGRLVLAGPTPPHGNSLAREAALLLGVPDLRSDVVDLGAISEAEKRWLYRHAALVLYPSTVEGFGMVPFEAARGGVPTLSTRRGSLDEVLPPGIPVLDGFDVQEAADRAWKLLVDSSAASELTDALRARARDFTWDATAERLVGLFDAALRQPRGQVLVLEGEDERLIGVTPHFRRPPAPPAGAKLIEQLYHSVISRPGLRTRLSPDGSRRQQVARSVLDQVRRQAR